jgi:hypothetical protein
MTGQTDTDYTLRQIAYALRKIREHGSQGVARSGLDEVDAADPGCAESAGLCTGIERALGDDAEYPRSSGWCKRVGHRGEASDDVREALHHAALLWVMASTRRTCSPFV